MRILLISDHADPLAEIGSKEAGGQNIYVLYLVKFLSKLGIFVDVYTRWDRRNKKEVIKLNNHSRIIRVKAGPKKYIPRDNFLEVVDEFSENILKRIEKEKIQYDMIHTNYWFSGIIGVRIAESIKKPLVHVYHSIGQIRFESLGKLKLQEANNEFFKQRIVYEKEIAVRADKIISTSTIEKKIIKNLFSIEGDKIEVIPIGVDVKVFNLTKKRQTKELTKANNIKTILYVGRIEWRKGIGTLLYAFRDVIGKYPNSRLQIIGGGRSKATKKLEDFECERLKKIADELGIGDKVFFLGAKKQKQLCRYYSLSDVCVVPSYYEPFGIVPLESMACGTPVVASRTGGLQFSIKDGETGHLAEPRNYKDLAKKIIMTLKNGKKFYEANCLNRITNNFVWERIALQYKDFFNKLIKTK